MITSIGIVCYVGDERVSGIVLASVDTNGEDIVGPRTIDQFHAVGIVDNAVGAVRGWFTGVVVADALTRAWLGRVSP